MSKITATELYPALQKFLEAAGLKETLKAFRKETKTVWFAFNAFSE